MSHPSFRSLAAALFILPAAALFSQDASPTPTPTINSRVPLWTCKLSGGVYEVALHSIISISSHQYIVDAAARVTEVNIDTAGNSLVRFYYVEPLTPSSPVGFGQTAINKLTDYAKNAAVRSGQQETLQSVVKNYPATTHAHTVEYRIDSQQDLDKIFRSADTAFRTQTDTTCVIATPQE